VNRFAGVAAPGDGRFAHVGYPEAHGHNSLICQARHRVAQQTTRSGSDGIGVELNEPGLWKVRADFF
jgi:hypothetical protein